MTPMERHRRFNAATAVRPWRTTTPQDRIARMVALQCGHGGEAVENRFLPIAVCAAFLLQCGHGGEAVENSSYRPLSRESPHSFNAATAVRPWRTTVSVTFLRGSINASMRPR